MREPVRVADRGRFDTLIDARSPAEYALDHIPGAINCPVLDDDERRIVGTLYKQQGAFEARRVGGAMVAANLARHLRERFADKPAQWTPLVYCWRGGLRSGSMTQWLRLVGWDAQQLAGGYKSWRRHVIDTLAALLPRLRPIVLAGATGSAKTRVLHALAAGHGAQAIDLEALARHKGSLLGEWPGQAQPAQTAFETALACTLEALDLSRPVWLEAESARIGRIALPPALVAAMRAAPVVEIVAPPSARVAYLLRDYAYLGERPDRLAECLTPLTPLHGKEVVAQWQAWARAGELPPLFEELARRHYDPAYARSQGAHFGQWATRTAVTAQVLDEAGIAELAGRLADVAASLDLAR